MPNKGGLLLLGFATLLLCQVFGGDALGRLNVSGAGPTQAAAAGSSKTGGVAAGPYTGLLPATPTVIA